MHLAWANGGNVTMVDILVVKMLVNCQVVLPMSYLK